MFVKDKLVMLLDRVTWIEKNKTVITKEKDEEVYFIYIEQDISKFPLLEKLLEINMDIRKLLPLDVYSLDFLVDNNDKIWILETNTASGIVADGLSVTTMGGFYRGIYEDFYKRTISPKKHSIIKSISDEYREELRKTYPEEFSKSKYAI